MKLTWFGGTTIRIYISGQIFVADPSAVIPGVDAGEIASGADRVFSLAGADGTMPVIDPAQWRPRRPVRVIDEGVHVETVEFYRIGNASVLIDAPGEAHAILVVSGEPPRFGRWADAAVVLFFGDGKSVSRAGRALLEAARPKLIALAVDEAAAGIAIDALRDQLDGTGLVVLEPSMAVEA